MCLFSDINNGVYKSGFAKSQQAYNEAVTQLFKSLDRVSNKVINMPINSLYMSINLYEPGRVQINVQPWGTNKKEK